mmetsp:Transcript_10441/g.21464  ORF Transcript_10441/g.21464 Transcript_10441/m.21464 type:complete len:443 (-) Transcript_10441:266-1594(-)|eukprot:CAMPEP_0172450856 /NCGR_PEP_ID=MMETSP1065-20121228/9059_1 /TAXON_ID=265537 /ORGANISM="Amphiprora paludosa, Strain CCMP125" /LENGTH=442 /DNA_ID=CAMNT_0013202699 /DNA_START=85 /DNA_END=1413 /DNA_ORIENTATION=+
MDSSGARNNQQGASATGPNEGATPPALTEPKQNLSAYNLFFQVERQRIIDGIDQEPISLQLVQEIIQKKRQDSAHAATQQKKSETKRVHKRTHGKVSFPDLARRVATRWKNVDPATKAIFEFQARIEKEEYLRKKHEWKQYQEGKLIPRTAAGADEAKQEGQPTVDHGGSSTTMGDQNSPYANAHMQQANVAHIAQAMRNPQGHFFLQQPVDQQQHGGSSSSSHTGFVGHPFFPPASGNFAVPTWPQPFASPLMLSSIMNAATGSRSIDAIGSNLATANNTTTGASPHNAVAAGLETATTTPPNMVMPGGQGSVPPSQASAYSQLLLQLGYSPTDISNAITNMPTSTAAAGTLVANSAAVATGNASDTTTPDPDLTKGDQRSPAVAHRKEGVKNPDSVNSSDDENMIEEVMNSPIFQEAEVDGIDLFQVMDNQDLDEIFGDD